MNYTFLFKPHWRPIICLLGALLWLSDLHGEVAVPVYEGIEIDLVNYRIATLYKGPDKSWVADSLDVEGIYHIVSQEQNLWHLELSFSITNRTIDGSDTWMQLRTNINAASIYLNDSLLIRNGIVEDAGPASLGGKNLVRKRIPRRYLVNGINKIEVKFSNYKDQKGALFRDLSLGTLEEFLQTRAVMSTAPILFSGIFLFALFLNLALYFSLNRNLTFIALAILFLVYSLLVIYEALYWNGLVPSSSFIHSYTLRRGLEYLTYFILLFVLYFEYGYQKKFLALSIFAFIAIYILASLSHFTVAIALSILPLIISFFALVKGVKNSLLITLALFVLFGLNYIDDNNLIEDFDMVHSHYIVTSIVYKLDNLGMLVFALVMIFTSAKGILFKVNTLNETQLKLERLEYQFLQKRILPHFLINSLMSLQQLIFKDPQNASAMVEALSEEFYLLAAMSKKKLIPIHQEIEMCQMHLKIMSIQQRANYRMMTYGIVGDEMIPPAIIHTLVENGITHGYAGDQDANFTLSKNETPRGTQYVLFNDSKIQKGSQKPPSGTGLKYVEARLEECYPSQWKLNSNSVENGWEAIIEINDKV